MGTTFQNILWVFLGGGIGSILRYQAGLLAMKHFSSPWPVHTWIVNMVGSLLIGIFLGMFKASSRWEEAHHIFWIVGFCGGFTTFSSFSLENLRILQDGDYLRFIAYAMSSLFVGVALVAIGYWCGQKLL